MKAWVGSGVRSGGEVSPRGCAGPTPGPGELLVSHQGCRHQPGGPSPTGSRSVIRRPAPLPIPGLEAAGEVVAVGPDVAGYRGGERVAAMVQGGCAEYVRVNAALAMAVPPRGMTWVRLRRSRFHISPRTMLCSP